MPNSKTAHRRGNGDGSIYYNQSRGSWVVQYYVDGQRKTKYSKSKSEARELLVKAQSMLISGTYIDPSSMTLQTWMNIWFEEYMLGKRTPKTVEGHYNSMINYIIPLIGKIKLKDLKGYHVQKMYYEISKTRSARSVQLVNITLNVALKQAIMNDLISVNVTDKCVLPKHYPKKSRALTLEEQTAFVRLIRGHRYELIYLLSLYSGLRRGEAITLQWSDIDLESLRIHINKTAARVKTINPQVGDSKTKIIVKPPKSRSSERVVPLAKQLVPLFKEHWKKSAEQRLELGSEFNPDNYIFTDESGSVLDGGYVSTVFHRLTKDLFEKPATAHTLRHTFVTRGAENGVSMKVMQELCGHSTIDITTDIYTHVSDEFKEKEFAKINMIL